MVATFARASSARNRTSGRPGKFRRAVQKAGLKHAEIAGHSIFEKLSDPPGCEATIQASTALKGGPRVVDQSLSRR
jgi:hypothetical protein